MAYPLIQNFGVRQKIEKITNNNNDEEEEEAPPYNRIEINIENEEIKEEMKRKLEISNALRIQAELLEETLIKRLEELKRICIEEAELTGQLPKEIYKTLLPGEPEPIIKRRVGTTFKFPQKLLNDNNQIDELGRLETEIVLNKRIVAAAERLATDWSANKGLRKKRRRDLQMATIKLRTLEKDLNRRICLSNSKPDVSTPPQEEIQGMRRQSKNAGSGFSLNSLKNWPNFYNTIKWGNPSTKSCPSTPHGSVLDLAEVATNISPQKKNRKDSKKSRKTPTNAKNLHNLIKKEEQQKLLNSQQIPTQQNQKIKNCCSSPTTKLPLSFSTSASSSSTSSYSSSLSLNGPTPSIKGQKINGGTVSATISSSSGISASTSASLASASSTNLITPPPIPCRRSSAGSSNKNNKSSPSTLKETSNFFIKTEMKEEITTNNSTHLYANIGYTSSAPYKSAYRQSNFPTLQNTQKSLSPTNNCCYNNCYSVPSTSIFNNKEFPSSKQHLNTLINSSSISSSSLPRFNKISPQQSLLIPSYYSSSSLDRRALKLKKNQTENKQSPQLRLQQKPPPFYGCHLNESFVKQFSLQRKNAATTFPVDTKLNPFESTDSPNSPQNTFNLNKMLEKDESMENLLVLIHNTTFNN